VTPDAKEHLDKARRCLIRARTILAAGVGEDPGRNAYLAAFHAAQALIAERTGKDAKTHKGVHAQFARLTRNEPRLGRGDRNRRTVRQPGHGAVDIAAPSIPGTLYLSARRARMTMPPP
jgi:hypothetical protein